ncbi:MAG: glycerol-3-phosphate dehydrogenase [Pseudomonadota bacterium]
MYDIFIIGGGVNGAGIARDAAGRGLKVGLAERDDLGSHTSSSSTKLIHGGLRYLEQYEFRLVREALIEREVLLAAAPHIIWPLRFVLPHHRGLRPAWLLQLGLFIYDHLGGRQKLPPAKRLRLDAGPYRGVLQETFVRGFSYSDCWVEDSRLVVLNAVDAHERGADIFTRTECVALERSPEKWRITLKDADGLREVFARVVVNASGPWVDQIDAQAKPKTNTAALRLVKGSHIVLRRIYEGDHAFIFQHEDGRIVFAIPYEQDFTLIGTTDVAVDSASDGAEVSADEEKYLCDLVSSYFAKPVTPKDIVWRYAGVRPLFDDAAGEAAKVTRDYTLVLDDDEAPILSVYGGKITTFRKLAEHALEKLKPNFPRLSDAWTKTAPLPGGEIKNGDYDAFLTALLEAYPTAPARLVDRLARAYGARAPDILSSAFPKGGGGVRGQSFVAGDITAAELDYLIEHEFAQTADDVLWRRSKLGLHLTPDERKAVDAWFAENAAKATETVA